MSKKKDKTLSLDEKYILIKRGKELIHIKKDKDKDKYSLKRRT